MKPTVKFIFFILIIFISCSIKAGNPYHTKISKVLEDYDDMMPVSVFLKACKGIYTIIKQTDTDQLTTDTFWNTCKDNDNLKKFHERYASYEASKNESLLTSINLLVAGFKERAEILNEMSPLGPVNISIFALPDNRTDSILIPSELLIEKSNKNRDVSQQIIETLAATPDQESFYASYIKTIDKNDCKNLILDSTVFN